MPYVKAELRQALDPAIRELARAIVDAARDLHDETGYAGLLNYACTSVAMRVIEGRFGKIRYGTIATVTGVFKNVADEFYRRVAAPYEDRQIAANGDVPLYEEYAERGAGPR
jgi:hypothetical protein